MTGPFSLQGKNDVIVIMFINNQILRIINPFEKRLKKLPEYKLLSRNLYKNDTSELRKLGGKI